MKTVSIVLIVFCFFLTTQTFSQNILNVYRQYVLIDIAASSGLKIGDYVSVLRKMPSGKTILIGKLSVIKFVQRKYVGKLTDVNPKYQIRKGDFIQIPAVESKSGHFLSYTFLGMGLVTASISYSFLERADKTYSKYEIASTQPSAVHLYNQAVRYDRYARISAGVGAGLAAFGLIHALVIERKGHTPRSDRFSINPFKTNICIGIKFAMNVNRINRF